MKYLKTFGIAMLYVFIILFIGVGVVNILNYFDIISEKTTNTLLFIISIISMIIGGFKLGINHQKHGWAEGTKLGLCIIAIYILESLIIKYQFHLYNYIYYGILILSSILGSIIGVNQKQRKK